MEAEALCDWLRRIGAADAIAAPAVANEALDAGVLSILISMVELMAQCAHESDAAADEGSILAALSKVLLSADASHALAAVAIAPDAANVLVDMLAARGVAVASVAANVCAALQTVMACRAPLGGRRRAVAASRCVAAALTAHVADSFAVYHAATAALGILRCVPESVEPFLSSGGLDALLAAADAQIDADAPLCSVLGALAEAVCVFGAARLDGVVSFRTDGSPVYDMLWPASCGARRCRPTP